MADRVEVWGIASSESFAELAAGGVNFDEAVVIVDIEGGEYGVLTRAALEVLRGAQIVVELHEWVDAGGLGLKRILADSAAAGFEASFLTMGARDLSGFEELVEWPDDDRWILCSESRQRLMRWLVLEPVG